jgi:ribosome-associated protein
MAKRARKDEPARALATAAAQIAHDDHCQDVVVLDLRGVSPVTDYFVIATGTSGRQMRTVAEDISRHGKNVGQKPWHISGLEGGQWILLDFVDVVVHLFDPDRRRYYDLELLWGEVPRVEWAERKRTRRKKTEDEPAKRN